jgi:hypothetical protein
MNATSLGIVQKWDGRPIRFPGIYSGVPMDAYHSPSLCIEPSVSSSTLRTLWAKSPAHAWDRCPLNPRRDDDDETEALILGRAVHHLLLGEARWQDVFVMRPDDVLGESWHGNKKVCREWMAKRRAEGLTVLTPVQFDGIKGMAESLAREPLVQAGILNGAIEQSTVWKDQPTGMWCKARPDAVPNDSLDYSDLKTTLSVQVDDLRRTIMDYGYHQQAAFVGEACRQILRRDMTSFSLVFVEKKRPFCTRIVTLRDADISRGAQINRRCLDIFAECYASGNWPGPAGDQRDAAYIDLPEWGRNRIDERLKGDGK